MPGDVDEIGVAQITYWRQLVSIASDAVADRDMATMVEAMEIAREVGNKLLVRYGQHAEAGAAYRGSQTFYDPAAISKEGKTP